MLLDVSLEASLSHDGRTARTSVRMIADHLGITPGTAARCLGRLRTAGLVQRLDRRDAITGRFVESVYVVAPTVAVRPCVDCPLMAELHTERAHRTGDDALNGDAGQLSPLSMASVCRSFVGRDHVDLASEDRVTGSRGERGHSQDRDRQGDASFGESRTC
ncbi:MAG: helix-turn-helix domain-containing protein [Actinomycetota bacterium]